MRNTYINGTNTYKFKTKGQNKYSWINIMVLLLFLHHISHKFYVRTFTV